MASLMPRLTQSCLSNFHSKLSQDFGRTALDLFRSIERQRISKAKWSNHLHFNLSLKYFKIFPVSLSIASTVKGPRAEKILFTAQRSLLCERIRQTVTILKNIRKDRDEAEFRLMTLLDASTLANCRGRFHPAFNHHFSKTRDKQKAKLNKLVTNDKKRERKERKAHSSDRIEKTRENKEKMGL